MKHTNYLIVFCSFILLVGLSSCNLPMLKYLDGFHENYQPSQDIVLKDPYTYSSAQMAVIEDLGYPARFMIIFGEDSRQETWFYDNFNYKIAFIAGEKVSDQYSSPGSAEGLYKTDYRPDQFYRGMGIDEIVLSTGSNDFALTSISEMVENGRLMHLNGLSIGLIDGQISFVETYPAQTEETASAAEPTNNESLTPEEMANEGIHTYSALHYIDNVFDLKYASTVKFDFQPGEVCLTEKEISRCYQLTGTNEYSNEEQAARIIFTMEGFILYQNEGDTTIKVYYTFHDN